MKKYKALPQKLSVQKDAIIELAANGLIKSVIIRKLGLGANVFGLYKETGDWYLEGRAKLSEQITKNIIKAAPLSFLDRRLLADKLNLFHEPFETKKIASPAGARTLIATGIQKFCAGEISEQSLSTITRASLAFIESYNQTVLQKDMLDIKKQLKERV